jgi:hypothetical protein
MPALVFSARSLFPGRPGAQSGANSALAGNWQGTLTAGADEITNHTQSAAGPCGKLSATLDLPDQGATSLPVNHLSYGRSNSEL